MFVEENIKHDSYIYIVQSLNKSFHALGCDMNIKVHFLFSYLESFSKNLGDASDEQIERFHQDFCWHLKRDFIDVLHHRK